MDREEVYRRTAWTVALAVGLLLWGLIVWGAVGLGRWLTP